MDLQTNFIVIPEDRLRQIIREEQSACQKIAKSDPESDPLLTLEQCQDYIEQKSSRRPARQTIYDLTCKRKMPYDKFGKYLYFRQSAIDKWLANGRQMA